LFRLLLPAGAVLTHVNLISNAAGTTHILTDLFQAGDRHLSYLPLAHIYERVNVLLVNVPLLRRLAPPAWMT
jgi:long-chain acyl-CoA synthetase